MTSSVLIIQAAPENKNEWFDCFTEAETIEEAREDIQFKKEFNPNRKFRIIERTTTIVDKVLSEE